MPDRQQTFETCTYPTGTVWTGPKTCGKRAKFRITETFGECREFDVCGIHRRTALRWGAVVREEIRQ